MKKIKFRAYDKTRKEYLSVGHIYLSINAGVCPKDCAQYLDVLRDPDLYAGRFEIEQFTGLKDCVAHEIYEGDILCFDRYGKNLTAVVKWNEQVGAWCLQLCHESCCGSTPMSVWLGRDSLKVIGNIHENPELMKGGEQ